jgi:hypothetical protein
VHVGSGAPRSTMGESGDAGRVGERCLQGKWRLEGDERPYMYMQLDEATGRRDHGETRAQGDESTRRRDHGETRPQGDETGNDTKGDQLREIPLVEGRRAPRGA